jgi:uncharacterized membrane protein
VATGQASQAMEEVSGLSQQAEVASRDILQIAAHVGEVAATVRGELDQFLVAFARGGNDNRRNYERIRGRGQQAVVARAGEAGQQGEIVDISVGGVALAVTLSRAVAGEELLVRLPGGSTPVPARVVRQAEERLHLAFRQHPDVLAAVESAMSEIVRAAKAEA